ncbi:hypothetical protein EVAR_36980_1 [Eumeta japonica]|uniref:Uncharacterized protein n=1 Tax=Eumeta variegata TaxID=151549 RepID=A0A4C1WAI7_EUMVA|nr:hypothetical protein EVAR_36980_1 [Eumeta japonica]
MSDNPVYVDCIHNSVVRCMKFCHSELAANDILRRQALRSTNLPSSVHILRHCDAFVTNFTAANFHYNMIKRNSHASSRSSPGTNSPINKRYYQRRKRSRSTGEPVD